MTQLPDRIEGEIKNHEHKMLAKISEMKRQERLKAAQELIDSFERRIDDGCVSSNVSGFDSKTAAKSAAIFSLNNQISMLAQLMARTDDAADKIIANKIDDIKLEIQALESIIISGV